jgi:hypothetical protein
MLIISKESVIAIKGKIAGKRQECIADIERMVEIKQSHLWRADGGFCCGGVCELVSQLESEIEILQDALDAIKRGDDNKAASLLEGYAVFLGKNYKDEHPNYW